MLSSNPICPVCNYATSAVYCDLPTSEQLANGVKPLDSLPAAWWNKMWNMINCSVNQARGAVGSFITELNNVLAGAGICPNCVCTDQLYQAIDRIRQTIGNATVAGAVKSSTIPGMVSIDENGFMTANCVGNATQLATSARTLVGAVNELKTTYDTCFGSVSTALEGKAPTSHASSANTYGAGTSANYGHVKLSDSTASTSSTSGGTAATPAAVKAVQDSLNSNVNTLTTSISGKAPTSHASSANTYGVGTASAYGHLRISGTYTSDLKDAGMAASQSALYNVYNYATQISAAAIGLGNIAGCPLGTASAGTAGTAARSDHVHPIPSCVTDKYRGACYIGIGYDGPSLTAAQVTAFAAYSTSLETGCTVIKDVSADRVKQVLGLGSAAYCCASDFRSNTWVPDLVCMACGLPELAGLGCDPSVAWSMHNIWNYCQDNRNYLISYPSTDPSGNALQQTRVDYATCALISCVDDKHANYNYPIAITSNTAGTHGYYGISTACPFTFNPTTGVVTAQCFNGAAACATCTHNVIDYCDPTKPLQIAYNGPGLTCAQVTHLAAFSTHLESGKIIIKDVNRGTAQSWLCLGSAAYCDTTAFRPSSWTPSCVACAGQTASFGNVTATRNSLMRTWSVYALCSATVSSVPICDIVKAICWATNNFSQGSQMTVSGFMGSGTSIFGIRETVSGVNVYRGTAGAGCDWTCLCATCDRGWHLPLSFSGSY